MNTLRALYTTQGGGVCRYINGDYIWVDPPTDLFPEMQVGDKIPEEWGTAAINDAAIAEAEAR